MYYRYIGFSLIELLAVISILSILSVFIGFEYSSYILKGRRSDAMNTIFAISLAEERYRSSNSSYGTLSQVWPVTTSQSGYYSLNIINVSATSYTIVATAIGSQAKDSDGSTSCSVMQLSSSNGTITKTPTNCWPP